MTILKDVLGAYGWENVRVEVLHNLAHYIPDEQPEKTAQLSSATRFNHRS
jgi:hypothetical protein